MTEAIEELPSEIEAIISDPFIEEILLRKDLAYFAETVLNMEIVGHHKDWSRLCATHRRICINSSRDHGKSYFWCFAYAIWRAYYHWIPPTIAKGFKSIPRNSLGYIFSNTQDQAIKHLALIKEEILTNPKLSHLVPEGKGASGPSGWSQKEIKLANGASIRAFGWGSSVRGAHPGWAVADDVLNDESIYSELTRRKQKDYFFSAVTPMVIPGGQIVVVGTPFHADDLYHDLDENKEYTFNVYPALDESGNPLWPTRYPKDILDAKLREVGSVRFSREYLCIPVSDESSLFPEKMLRACFNEDFTMPSHITQSDMSQLQIFTGVDLALSTTVGADYTVLTTIGVDEFQTIWILNISRFKGMGMSEQLKRIEMVYNSFKPHRIFIEDNVFQRVFRDELVRTTSLPIQGFTTGTNKNSLEKGVPSLQILFENRKIQIPRATQYDREITDVLVNELRSFSFMDGKLTGVGSHDDCVMSFWIAVECARKSAFSFAFA